MPRKYKFDGLTHEDRRFYTKYMSMLRRCNEKTNKDYYRYGKLGVRVLWKNYKEFHDDMYGSFLLHVQKHGKENTSLDRIDGAGHYEKKNCRWVTPKTQARNRKTNRYITYKGKTLIVADWANYLGASRQAVRYRLEKGWPPKLIIETPFKHTNQYDSKNKIIRSSAKNSRS